MGSIPSSLRHRSASSRLLLSLFEKGIVNGMRGSGHLMWLESAPLEVCLIGRPYREGEVDVSIDPRQPQSPQGLFPKRQRIEQMAVSPEPNRDRAMESAHHGQVSRKVPPIDEQGVRVQSHGWPLTKDVLPALDEAS